MNALGWQIGAVLFGASFLIVSIYLAKVLNSAHKVVEKNMTFADLKNIMRKLFLEKQDIRQVNGTALLSKLKEE